LLRSSRLSPDPTGIQDGKHFRASAVIPSCVAAIEKRIAVSVIILK